MLKSDVSVVLCTYNGEAFLGKQLDSILFQSYTQIELIVVDDNSSDSTQELLKRYQKEYENIRLYFNEHTLGYTKNFAKALSLAEGKYICISDQDDIWHQDKIRILVENLGENWLIFSNSELIDINDVPTGAKLLNDFQLRDDYKSILLENFVSGHTCLLSNQLKQYIFPIPEEGFYDWWIGFVALHHHKLVCLNQVLTKYRVHESSVIQKASVLSDNIVAKKNLATQLSLFLTYKDLGIREREFITVLKDDLNKSGNPLLKPIYFLLLKNMKLFFPQKKEKSIFSKMNFLYKYLKMHQ